ncbi:MAG: hypothetical protein RLZZ245_1630 [Verrucomicrobiota bacterium]|jgi:prepilin-type N-terminal cleavage/methylation domain-containing protein
MKSLRILRTRGFTLLETVIAIGVLAVLLTGFMIVFAPAAEGIKKSINVQQADRLASTLESELVTKRDSASGTGFDKAFDWIRNSSNVGDALLIYQYRGKTSDMRSDGTPEPLKNQDMKGKLPGKDYIVVSMLRRKSDSEFTEDLEAIEGAVYLVKCTQLIFNANEMILNPTAGTIKDPKGTATFTSADDYPEAVIAFAADFHMLPAKTPDYFSGAAFTKKFAGVRNPVFSRNLAVRR